MKKQGSNGATMSSPVDERKSTFLTLYVGHPTRAHDRTNNGYVICIERSKVLSADVRRAPPPRTKNRAEFSAPKNGTHCPLHPNLLNVHLQTIPLSNNFIK